MLPTDFGLGRRHALDERDQLHTMQAVLPAAPKRDRRYWYANGWWGNQGNTQQCVAYAWDHWIEDGPVTHTGQAPLIDPVTLYSEARQNDEWEGEDYDGTSVRGAAKALQARGLIQEYRWAWDAETVRNAILTAGPVVIGINWYESMFFPDKNGVLTVAGNIAGGHALLVDGYYDKSGLFRLKNSWGRDWGDNGFARISGEDLDKLIKEDGEACLAVEL
jgi:C1A family cysteine protease